jgi:hypothetical protein
MELHGKDRSVQVAYTFNRAVIYIHPGDFGIEVLFGSKRIPVVL